MQREDWRNSFPIRTGPVHDRPLATRSRNNGMGKVCQTNEKEKGVRWSFTTRNDAADRNNIGAVTKRTGKMELGDSASLVHSFLR